MVNFFLGAAATVFTLWLSVHALVFCIFLVAAFYKNFVM
jgi:hypothetical protein